jgi:hypothetical protein
VRSVRNVRSTLAAHAWVSMCGLVVCVTLRHVGTATWKGNTPGQDLHAKDKQQ